MKQLEPTDCFLNIISDCFSTYKTTNDLLARITPLLNEPKNSFFIFLDQERLKGILIVSAKAGSTFTIEALAVAQSSRNKKVGTHLMQFFIETKKPKKIQLETDHDSLGFYLRNNFEVIHTELKYPAFERFSLEWLTC